MLRTVTLGLLGVFCLTSLLVEEAWAQSRPRSSRIPSRRAVQYQPRSVDDLRLPARFRSQPLSGLTGTTRGPSIDAAERYRREGRGTGRSAIELPAIYSGQWQPRQYFMRLDHFRPLRPQRR